MNAPIPPAASALTPDEQAKRNQLMARKPYVAKKLARIADMEARGEVSPIIRLEKSYLCNFQCTHCSAEYYMDRHLEKVLKVKETRQTMDIEDVRNLSREADELGLARFVITGGEPLVMKDFDAVVAAIDPDKHYVVTDTNGWFLDAETARHIQSIGVEKVQLSLDSFVEQDHDAFRNKPGSYRRVMRAVDACLDAGLNLILSTVLVKGRVKTEEFREMCEFATNRGIGLYVSYAKPTGSCTEHPELVIAKEDADLLRELEKRYKVFTHMTPSYGSFKGCIAVKGIVTVTSSMEVTPCPYIDFSLGNLRETPLKEVLARGMRNPWLGPYRSDCLIGEDAQFIRIHTEKTKGVKFMPLPWGQGFSDRDSLLDGCEPSADATLTQSVPGALFDAHGRCLPGELNAAAHATTRRYFRLAQPALAYDAIYDRTVAALGSDGMPTRQEFQACTEAILERLRRDPATQYALNGVHVPFILPRQETDDIGEALETRYLPAVASAFKSRFGQYDFVQYCKDPLGKTLSPAPGSRHDRLLDTLRQGPVVGLFLPALLEYSVPAAIERIAGLPDKFLLAAGFDTCAALIGSPDLLHGVNAYPPTLWLAALATEQEGLGYRFEAYGYNLIFNRQMHFGKASEYGASALVVIQ